MVRRKKGTTTRTLTDLQVMNYRRAYEEETMSSREIMEETNLSMNSVRRMLSGETYRNIAPAKPRINGEDLADSARRFVEAQAQGGIVLNVESTVQSRSADAMLEELKQRPGVAARLQELTGYKAPTDKPAGLEIPETDDDEPGPGAELYD